MGKEDKAERDLLKELDGWGGPAEMSAFEAVMWRAEVNPQLRSTTTSVMILDSAPDWSRLVAAHEWMVASVPRFRQRVVVPALGVGNPVWVDDQNFRLDYHLRRVSLPAPGDDRQLFEFGQTQAMIPFDKSRSPWESTLVEGLSGGRAGFILKLHHSTSDGMGIVQLLSRVMSKQREPMNREKPKRPPLDQSHVPSPVELSARQLAKTAASIPSAAAGVAANARERLTGWLKNPDDARQDAEYLASIKRVMGIKPVKGSGLFKKRSLSWRFDHFSFPLTDLKAGAKAAGGTINDAFLSGLMGGFRLYHEEMGVTAAQMPIGFPISLRNENDPMGGNKFAGSQYAAPINMLDPAERIAHIQDFVRTTKAEPALDFMIRMMPAISKLPLAAITSFMGDFVAAQDAQISNVPGVNFPVYMAGAEVTHLYPFAPAPGCGMMITMLSHNGTCCVGINADQAAVTEPELLTECLKKGMDEVFALARESE